MPTALRRSIRFARDVSVDIPWRTSDKRQRTVLAHEAADLTSMRVGWMVPLFGCGIIPVSSHGGEIAEAEASGEVGRPKPKWRLGVTL